MLAPLAKYFLEILLVMFVSFLPFLPIEIGAALTPNRSGTVLP